MNRNPFWAGYTQFQSENLQRAMCTGNSKSFQTKYDPNFSTKRKPFKKGEKKIKQR